MRVGRRARGTLARGPHVRLHGLAHLADGPGTARRHDRSVLRIGGRSCLNGAERGGQSALPRAVGVVLGQKVSRGTRPRRVGVEGALGFPREIEVGLGLESIAAVQRVGGEDRDLAQRLRELGADLVRGQLVERPVRLSRLDT